MSNMLLLAFDLAALGSIIHLVLFFTSPKDLTTKSGAA